MKKLLLSLIFLTACTVSQPVIEKEVFGAVPPRITAPENNGYKIGVANFQQEFKDDITSDRPLQYKLDDKFISFKPTRMYFDGLTLSSKFVETSLKTQDREYKEVFGEGIDLKMNISGRVWEKLIKINSLKDIGTISPTAQNLIIEFEIETNFIIDGWDKKSDLEIVDKIRLGDFSYIEQANIWDSYNEEVCDVIDEEEVCETLTNRQKVRTVLSARDGKEFISKYLPVDWLKVAQYPSWTDVDVTYGTPAIFFSTAVATSLSVAELDTDQFVVCYGQGSGLGSDGACRAANVSGTTISYGTESDFDSDISCDNSPDLYVCKVTTDTFAVAYCDDGSADDGFVLGATIDATPDITYDIANRDEFNTADTESIGCGQIGTNKIAIAYNDETGGEDGEVVVCTFSGTVPTCGTSAEFANAAAPFKSKICHLGLGTDNFIVTWEDTTGTDTIEGLAASTTGTTINLSDDTNTFDASDSRDAYCDNLDIDKIVEVWASLSTTPGESEVCTVDTGASGRWDFSCGITEDYGEAANNVLQSSVVKIDSTQFVISYRDLNDSGNLKSILSTYSGTTITQGSPETVAATSIDGQNARLISTDKIVICYNSTTATDGVCIIGDVSAVAADVFAVPDLQHISGYNADISGEHKTIGH